MTKRILLTSLIVLLSGGLLGCYFYFVGALARDGRQQARCRQVEVFLPDSLESTIVDKQEMCAFLQKNVGRPIDSIDLHALEMQIRSRGEVMDAQVYTVDEHTLTARISQRKPVVRLENGQVRWYADPDGYLFPVRNAVDVPLVTGRIPLTAEPSYKGFAPEQEQAWMEGIVALARYIDSKPVLRREIAQIDVDSNGDLVLYTRRPGPGIIFGDSSDYITKFQKLEAWWRNIEPQLEPGKTYKTINLKYNQQIICRQL